MNDQVYINLNVLVDDSFLYKLNYVLYLLKSYDLVSLIQFFFI